MLNNLLFRERDSINYRISYLKSQIESLPKGKILCARNGKNTKWYLSNGGHPIYIPKKNKMYAEQLALKHYYELCMQEAEAQLQILNDIISKEYRLSSHSASKSSLHSTLRSAAASENSSPTLSSEIYLNSPGYKELLESYFCDFSKDIKAWKEEQYIRNTSYSEHLIHPTYAGELVRSKSEVIIANTLYQYKIPYRYECELKLGGVKCYPDFTIFHPKRKGILYWEHFGLMNDEVYRSNIFSKMKLYGDYSIIPSINLITTYEDKTHPLQSTQVESIVGEYFGIMFS